MNVSALILFIIVLLFEATIIVCNKFIKKITNYYGFGLSISVFALIGFFVGKQVPDIQNYIHGKNAGLLDKPGQYDQSIIIAKAFSTQTCQFMAVVIPVLLIADPTRKAARAFAPIGIFASAMVLIQMVAMPGDFNHLTAKFIFIGEKESRLFFWYHFMTLSLSVGILLNTPKYQYKGGPSVVLAILINYCYTGIIMAATGCAGDVSGLSTNDGTSFGSYGKLSEILKVSPSVAPLICIPVFWIISFGNVLLKDLVFERFKGFKYPKEKSNKGYHGYNTEQDNQNNKN